MDEPQRPTPQEYADIFEVDKRGQRILEDLLRRFVRPPVTDGGIDAVLKTYRNLGKRDPLDFIVNQINRSHGIEPETKESNDER